ncbi:hypothetical protein [Streptomyces sp. H34-S4]|uniref:hypothetical protein n=1 Tax=Streptomyces sp. H34-S4 TaxID=2996463 RepID=UPI00227047AD|nr:hypothetical protein [Streptomyces sp. H34-S4]MCY0936902.1 hypothetical protein [Streptomyces sp. H34-S4]
MYSRTSQRRLAASLAASVALVSGCMGSVDPDELPGVYQNDETGAELRLEPDREFSATDVVTDGFSDPVDFTGRWEWLDDQASSDFIYLSVEHGGLGTTSGIQLYPRGGNVVEFRPDPDGPPSLKLTKVAAP